jgi:hypothetical protein
MPKSLYGKGLSAARQLVSFSRIVQKQALRAADPTIDLPLPQGHARRPPKGATKARRRHLHDVRHGLERDRSS